VNEENGKNNQEEYVYKKVMLDKKNSRAWSVASIAVSTASLICCCFVDWLGVILSVLAIVFALISRKNIGYFDGLSLAGLIVGIFGIVFGITSIVLGYLKETNPALKEFFDRINETMNENGNGTPGGNPGNDIPQQDQNPPGSGGPTV